MTDTLSKFMFDDATVRGELVELNTTWQQILKHHQYPPSVRNLLGELTAAATLLCANLKFDGTMIMQIHGDGAVKLLVVECNNNLQLRSMAKLRENAIISEDASLSDLIDVNGNGRFIITLDPSDKSAGQQPYQGIVPLEGASIAEIIENYMRQSEQLDTKLWLAADNQVCRGMLLQKLPYFGGKSKHQESDQEAAQQAWERAAILGNTLKAEELLSTDIATLMHRLYWEETLRVFDPKATSFVCTCSREKVGNMLIMLGKAEVTEAVTSLGKLDVNCDFCGKPYSFDAVDCVELFLPPEIKIHPDVGFTH
ncbi:molecular chaperone Hsp33 [Oxalobacteraceae bacterium GrIS 2.11]